MFSNSRVYSDFVCMISIYWWACGIEVITIIVLGLLRANTTAGPASMTHSVPLPSLVSPQSLPSLSHSNLHSGPKVYVLYAGAVMSSLDPTLPTLYMASRPSKIQTLKNQGSPMSPWNLVILHHPNSQAYTLAYSAKFPRHWPSHTFLTLPVLT